MHREGELLRAPLNIPIRRWPTISCQPASSGTRPPTSIRRGRSHTQRAISRGPFGSHTKDGPAHRRTAPVGPGRMQHATRQGPPAPRRQARGTPAPAGLYTKGDQWVLRHRVSSRGRDERSRRATRTRPAPGADWASTPPASGPARRQDHLQPRGVRTHPSVQGPRWRQAHHAGSITPEARQRLQQQLGTPAPYIRPLQPRLHSASTRPCGRQLLIEGIARLQWPSPSWSGSFSASARPGATWPTAAGTGNRRRRDPHGLRHRL